MDSTSNFVDDKSMLSAVTGTGGGGNLSNMSVELCLVCGDRASGRHYGAISCEGCKGFFKRSIRKQLGYQCRGTMNCEVTKHHRNRCQFCRLQKCLASGMRSDSVQHERKPIIDKKELHSSINSATNNANNTNSVIYHHRNKGSSAYSSHQSTTAAAAAAAAAAAVAGSAYETLPTVFSVDFNFSDLTQTLSKRALLAAAPYQQQQQQINQQSDNFSCSPGAQTNDDDSMDNSASGGGVSGSQAINSTHNLSGGQQQLQTDNIVSTASNPSASAVTVAAANLIQSSLEKHMITQSLELIAHVQQQYDSVNNIINNNNNNNSNNNSNNSNSNPANTIVKEELIIDDDQSGMMNDNNIDEDLEKVIFELPILPEGNVNFNLQIPTLVPSYLNLHYVCECGSRLLFLSVYWIKKIHAFQQLSEDIQVKLLRRHWVSLFAIGLSQCSRTLSMSTIMTTLVSNVIQIAEMEKISAHKIRKLCEHTCQLQHFVQIIQSMELNEHEYAYIRLIMIFSPDNVDIKSETKRNFIEKLQDYAFASFRNYLRDVNHPNPNNRCNKILLRLMQLCTLESDIIEELFFSSLIGQVQIENMIPYILKLGGGGI